MDLRLCLFLLVTTVAKPQENISPDCSLETDGFCDDGQEQSVESVELDQTIPKILLVGPTGSGKSSMANSLLGLDPENEDAMFPVCMDMDSCTKETTYAEGKWLGYGERFIVVDTPGLQDSDGQDNQLIREMVDVLKNKVKTVDCIVLLIEGKTERFHAGLTTQLRQLSTMFGARWWDFLLIGVSKWEYDEKTIRKRERKCVPGKKSCKDEKWFKRNILHQLEKKFHQTRSFNFAFIHSYSQIEDNKNDESEQKYWKEETDKLWSFVTNKNSSFELKGVDDILQDNRRLKRQVDELENTIDTEIADLKGEIQRIKKTHDSELNQLKSNTLGEIQMIKETHISELNQLKDNTLGQININKKTLDTEMEQVKRDTKSNADKILTNKNTLDTEMVQVKKDAKSNADKILANNKSLDDEMQHLKNYTKGEIESLTEGLSEVSQVSLVDLIPGIGSIIPWIPSPDGEDPFSKGKIPSGWQKCDGTKIKKGPFENLRTPNLNGDGLFLRGGTGKNVTQIQEDMILDHEHQDPGHSHDDRGHKHTQSSHDHSEYRYAAVLGYEGSGYQFYIRTSNNVGVNEFTGKWASTKSKAPTIQTSYADIRSAKTGVSKVKDDKSGHENRPKNMVVTFIMRIY